MTHLICSIMVDDVAALSAQVQHAWAQGADAIELRLDRYQGLLAPLRALLINHHEKTWILTCRSRAEGGYSDSPPAKRIELLRTVAEGTDAIIDFELADWYQLDRSSSPHNPDASIDSHRIMLSEHNFDTYPDNITSLPISVEKRHKGAIAKIAYTSRHINDSFAALDLMHEHTDRVVAIAMGDGGLWTRVLARKLGAFGSFAYLENSQATASGQLSISDMIERYRWHSIDASTKVYGVIGDPVAHSMSPVLFNQWFEDANINAVYLPLHVSANPDGLRQFLNACTRRPWLNISGLSVTVPHKPTSLDWAGHAADRLTQSIGAVNTLTFNDQGIQAHNTDVHAAMDSITSALRCDHKDLAGATVDMLGAGGSARAIVAGLRSYACQVTIYSRRDEAAVRLAEQLDAVAGTWAQRGSGKARILINTTPVGMWPEIEHSPMPTEVLQHYELVFDLIYNPMQTTLLADARALGKSTLNGLDMFIRQAAAQFQLWTGMQADTNRAYRLIEKELSSERPPTK